MNTNNNNNYLRNSNILMLRIAPNRKSIIIDFVDGHCSVARSVSETNNQFRKQYLTLKPYVIYANIAQAFIYEIEGTKYAGIDKDENWFINGFNNRCKDNDVCNIRLKLPVLDFTEKFPIKKFQNIQHGLDRITFNNFIVTYNLQFLLNEAYKAVGTYTIDKENNIKIQSLDWIIDAISAESKREGSKFDFNTVKKNLTKHNSKDIDACIAYKIIDTQIKNLTAEIDAEDDKLSDDRVTAILSLLNGNATIANEAVLEPTTTVVSENSINTLLDIKRVLEDENTVTTEMNGNKFIIDKKVNDCSTEFSIRSINGKSNDDVVSDHSDNFNDDDMFAIEMAIRESDGTLTDEFQDAIVCKEYESLRYDGHKWYPRRNVEREPMRQTVVPERYDAEKWSVNPNIAKVDRNNDYIDYKSEPLNCETVDPAVPNSNDNVDLIFTAVPGKHTVENDYSEFTDPINIELQQYREAHSEEFEPYVWQHDTVTVTKSKNKTRKTRK